MFENFFAQPTWPAAVTTLAAAILTVMLTAVVNARNIRFTQAFQRHGAAMAEQAAATASTLADLKTIELENAAATKYADIVERRAARLHEDFADLLSIVEWMLQTPPIDTDEDRRQLVRLSNAISLAISPRGAFAEELNIQLGHLREAAAQGASYLVARPDFLTSFQFNAWRIVDAEYDRAAESVSSGRTVPRSRLKPFRHGR
ncbi:hypothetical protein D2V17_19420 [Aurantiacibacter xanthus]|uniref:Uncharacterized protein n=1 Tax=Aurantiacibacter xanthus TaxID=1784712 RepID=A0A3A1P097_9SPHN|nr:hypothetical protein [Aurantiacibacter xanthus]RIV80483.1 hypothetical protein D2V17_19420 [Aurantiacibacter xanthus]